MSENYDFWGKEIESIKSMPILQKINRISSEEWKMKYYKAIIYFYRKYYNFII